MLRKTTSLVLVAALFLFVIAASLVWTRPGGASAAGRSLETRRATSPITVDGDLTEWPSGLGLVLDASTAQYMAGSIRNPLDLNASVFSAWDNTYLYIAATVNDDTLIADSSNIWDDDSIEIAIDGLRDGRCCGPDDHQYTLAVDGRLADFGTVIRAGTSSVQAAVQQQGAGYRVELAIPLVNLTGQPVLSGTVMGVNLGLNDDDDGGRRDKRLVWVGNTTLDFTNLVTLVFTGEAAPVLTRTPAAPVVGTPTPTSIPVATATRTATALAVPSSTATTVTQPSTTPTRTPSPSVTATPTISNQPTPVVDQRLATLETNVSTLEARLRSILDILQKAGRLPESAQAAAARAQAAGTVADPRAYAQGVNCGGAAYTTISGDFYAADQQYSAASGWGYVAGQAAQVTNAIANTADPILYQVERDNLPGYNFDVPPGKYEVTLRFAEIYQYAINRGRIFDVKIEDQVVVKDFDILGRAGHFTALDMTFTPIVTDGQLNIAFVPTSGVATINAIFVRGVDFPGPTPTPSSNDRIGAISTKLTELEALVSAILDAFRSTQPGAATATSTVTPTPTLGGPTRTPTSAVPTKTPTTIPTRTSTPTPGGPVETPHTSAKKGVAGGESPEWLRQVGVSWSYAWYIAPNNFNTVYEHVPMIYGRDYEASTVATVARAHPGSYWLLWNEPDYWQQANISPLQAAQIYRTLRPVIKDADPTARLIVGGVYNLDVAWIESFRSEYRRLYSEWPVVEGWHVHFYVGSNEYNTDTWRAALQYVRDWMPANGGAVELWLTEFGHLSSSTVGEQILAEQVPWLEAQPWITRYAWYASIAGGPSCPSCAGSLFNSDGTLTNLGRLYRTLP